MSRKTLWIALGAVFVLGAVQVCCPEDLTLREFVRLFAAADKSLDASRLKVEAARGTRAAQGYLALPGLEFNLRAPYRSWGRTYRYEAYQEETFLGYYEYREESYRMQLALSQELPSGGRLSVTGIGRQAQSDFIVGGFPPEVTIPRETGDKEFLMDVGISLDQPLFGPWDKLDAARSADLSYRKSRVQYKLDSAETVKRAINLFFDYLVAVPKERAEQLNLDLADSDARSARSLLEDGVISETEYLETSIDANEFRISHHAAKTTLDRIRRRMQTMDLPGEADLVPEDLSEGAGADLSIPVAVVSPEILRAKHDLELARIELAQAERKRFGRSTLSLWYGLEGLGESFDESRDLFRHNRWGGYLSVRFLLPEPGLGAEIEMARANLKLAQSAFEDASRRAEENRDLKLEEMRSFRARADLQEKRNRLLEDVIKIKRDQYETGLISLESLVEAEVTLVQARIDYLETMRNLNLAWVEITLLSRSDPLSHLSE